MHFEDQNWQQIETYLKNDDRIMIVLGACEQHSTLSLLTDSKIPFALADAASDKTGVLVAPPLHFGVSPYFLSYPGTISLRLKTYIDVVEDIMRSLHGYGFRRILLMNGHGGNTPVKTSLVELANELPDLQMRWYAWWLSSAVSDFAKQHNLETAHANWMENFTFTRISNAPGGSKSKPPLTGIAGKSKTRQNAGDGSYGGVYQVDNAIMQNLFNLCLDETLEQLLFDDFVVTLPG
ncbi:MAG: creatininase family protein [Anaerolineaceae bacterium]|nr:creatininase family protein [Anaerolineaceae bacterium]